MNNLCHRFETCSAPLCPLDPKSLAAGRWFPSETICHRSSAMVAKQRKVARLGLNDEAGYFTASMLNVDFLVRRGIHGLNPDRPLSERENEEAKWLAAHPGISPQRRAQMRELATRARAASSGFPYKKMDSHKGLSSSTNNQGSLVPPNGTDLGNGLMREER
jgi:hypothetical protein